MEENAISNGWKLTDCLNLRRISAALIAGGFLFYIYAYTLFNGDLNNTDYLRSIHYKHHDIKIEESSTKMIAENKTKAAKYYLNRTSELTITNKKDKVIFFWNNFFEHRDWAQGIGHKAFLNCEYKNCVTSIDKKKFNESDAMLCHMRSSGCAPNQLPKERKPHQYWIYYGMESQLNSQSGEKLKPLNGIFNLTMTFKLDSVLTSPYNGTNRVIGKIKDKNHKFYKGNKSSIAWVASNCWSSGAVHGRMAYLAQLRKFISVKRYGRCPGHVACGRDCFVKLAKQHKFYFAAENSLCKDYITEKPWNALNVGMIPVVYGLGNYSNALPPHSYIDVRDFKSPRFLAEYLKRVGSNETLYNSYFKWRELYRTSEPSSSSSYMCKICAFLNKPHANKSIVQDLDKKWSAAIDCINPHTFNQKIMHQR